jgi:hypothetical protein
MSNETTTFEAGRTYFYTFAGDSGVKVFVTIKRRTAKNVWIQDAHSDRIVRRAIDIYNGEETILPLGRFSMAPVLNARRVIK